MNDTPVPDGCPHSGQCAYNHTTLQRARQLAEEIYWSNEQPTRTWLTQTLLNVLRSWVDEPDADGSA